MTKTTPSSTAPLFGDNTPSPAATAASDSLAQLRVQKSGPTKLSPAQQRFNKLLTQVDKLSQQIQHIERLELEVRTPHLERMAVLDQQVRQVQSDMLFFLHERLQRKGLTSAQQKSVRSLVTTLLQIIDDGSEDASWAALRPEYLPTPKEDAQSLHEMKLGMLKDLEESLGMELNLGDVARFETPEQLLHAAMQKLEEHADAQEQQQAARKAKRPPNDKQRKVQEQEQDAKAALRTIYRQLASALHPDREIDPAERERKSALMGQANAAYGRGDLTTLLRLQLQAQQVDEASISRMTDDRVAALSLLLKNQVATLEGELVDAEMRLSSELGVAVRATIKVPQLNRLLREVQQELLDMLSFMQNDLERIRNDAEFKRWLREQTAMNKQNARLDAMVMEFGGFY